MTNQDAKKSNQLAILFSAFRFLLECLFPSLLILKVRNLVSKAAWGKDDWFQKQLNQCGKLMVLLLIPSLLSMVAAKQSFDELSITPKIEKSFAQFKKKQFKKSWDELHTAGKAFPLADASKKLALIFMFPLLISLYIRTQNDILVKTKRLNKVLLNNGFWKEGKSGLAVYTPIGIVLDVTGRSPKDIVHDTSIWYALNISVETTDWEEKPGQRSIVMFKKAFVLQAEYIYK
jgi:hypothetical protein